MEEDRTKPGDQSTAEIVQKVANSIFKFIQVEVDYPSLYPENVVPSLDLKVGVVKNKLIWHFYRKKMANFFVLMERLAMPSRTKRVFLVQEVFQILRNTKESLPTEI